MGYHVLIGHHAGGHAQAEDLAEALRSKGHAVILHRYDHLCGSESQFATWLRFADFYLFLHCAGDGAVPGPTQREVLDRCQRRTLTALNLLARPESPMGDLAALAEIRFYPNPGRGLLDLLDVLDIRRKHRRRRIYVAAGVATSLLACVVIAAGLLGLSEFWRMRQLLRLSLAFNPASLGEVCPRPPGQFRRLHRPENVPIHWSGIVIHHTDSHDVPATELRRWHQERGFPDIGYHFVVRKDGTIEAGRDLDTQGIHARDRNQTHIGISITGDFDGPVKATNAHRQPTPEQLASAALLTSSLVAQYGIDAAHVERHHDHCPGSRFPWDAFITRAKTTPALPLAQVLEQTQRVTLTAAGAAP